MFLCKVLGAAKSDNKRPLSPHAPDENEHNYEETGDYATAPPPTALGTHTQFVSAVPEDAYAVVLNTGTEDNTYDELDPAAPGSHEHLTATPQNNTRRLGAPDGDLGAEEAGRGGAHYTNVVDGDDGSYMLTPTAASLLITAHYPFRPRLAIGSCHLCDEACANVALHATGDGTGPHPG